MIRSISRKLRALSVLLPLVPLGALAACGGGLPPDGEIFEPPSFPSHPGELTIPDQVATVGGPSQSALGGTTSPTGAPAGDFIAADMSLTIPMIAEASVPKNSKMWSPAPRTITFGLPLPEDAGVQVLDGRPALRVAGPFPFQFTVNDIWPDGSAKWVLGHTVATVGQDQPFEFIVKSGAGRSKGSNLATELADRIVVDTGPLRFEVSTVDFRVFSRVIVDDLNIVKNNHSQGIVGTTVDGTALTLKQGAKVFLEDNGPARTVIRADGTMIDTLGNDVVDVTCRMIAGAEQHDVEVILTVRNANINRPAHVQIGSLGVEVKANTGLNPVARFNSPLGLITGDIAPGQYAYAYQSYCKAIAFDVTGNGPSYKPPIPKISATEFEQEGWYLNFDGNPVISFDKYDYPESGFANIGGVKGGITMAIKHMPHLWPASLEIEGTGSMTADVFSRRNPYHFAFIWRQHESRSMAFSFHSGPPTEFSQASRRLDNPAIARAQSYKWYDDSGVFPYPLVTLDEQEEAFAAMGIDYELDVKNDERQIHRFLPASSGGGHNNHSIIERWLIDEFLRHGYGGQLQRAIDLSVYKAEWQIPRSDNFHHTEDPGPANADLEVTSATQADAEHRYREGMIYTYYMTGDTRIRDALLEELEILPGQYISGQERGMYQTMRALVHLANFVDVVPGLADPLIDALRARVDFFCTPILDANSGADGFGWEAAPGVGARGYFVNSSQSKSEKPVGENYISRGFITGSLGAMAMHLVVDYLGPDDPQGMLAQGRLKDIARYTRQELHPYHPDPSKRFLVYSYGVQTQAYLDFSEFDFHSILLAMADGWRLTGDVDFLAKGIEFIESLEARGNLDKLESKLDNQTFFAAIRDFTSTFDTPLVTK